MLQQGNLISKTTYMILTKEEKAELKHLTTQGGFKVLEKLAKAMEYDLLTQFKTANLKDADVGLKLNWIQNKLAWAEYILNLAKSASQDIAEKKVQ